MDIKEQLSIIGTMDTRTYLESIGLTGAALKETMSRTRKKIQPPEGKTVVDVLRERVEYYKNFFGIENSDLVKMINRNRCLLVYEVETDDSIVTSMVEEMENFYPKEYAKKVVMANPILLNIPRAKVRARAMIAICARRSDALHSSDILVNEKKVWARHCMLKLRKCSPISLYINEYPFARKYGVSTETLMRMYPLDEKALKKIEDECSKIMKKTLTFSDEEIAELKGE